MTKAHPQGQSLGEFLEHLDAEHGWADCPVDDAGFHIDDEGIRTTRRDGRDAYAYICTVCGAVGDIVGGWFVRREEDGEGR